MLKLWEFWLSNAEEIIWLTGEHLAMVAVSIFAACTVGIPLGVLMTRTPRLERSVLGFANVVQTLPSLALFGLLIPVPLIGGIGKSTAIVALFLYALLPIIRNTYTGIRQVEPAVRESGRGMGMTETQLLRRIELPLAAGVILAGIRIAAVTAVGVATIAAAVGAGGLGSLIFRGVSSVNTTLILAGSIPAAGLALITDFGLGRLESRLSFTRTRFTERRFVR